MRHRERINRERINREREKEEPLCKEARKRRRGFLGSELPLILPVDSWTCWSCETFESRFGSTVSRFSLLWLL